jgi:hypothetical protein
MAYLIDVGLALSVSLLARMVGFDRDRAFYPTVMIVIASYYGLFAVMGGSTQALRMESVAMAAFLLVICRPEEPATTPRWNATQSRLREASSMRG